jgi:hypothetical protein
MKSNSDEEQYINIHNLVGDFSRLIDIQKKEIEELTEKIKAWEKCAENLVDYAHEFVAHLLLWGKDYGRYDFDIKQANAAIEEYERLKNESR